MTKQERIRAIFGNLKNYTWEVNPTYSINEQDAFVLREMYGEYLALKMAYEKEKARQRAKYRENAEKIKERSRERYWKKKEEIARQAHERYELNKEENRAKARENYYKKKGEIFNDHK